jgi:hypothetical protein
MILIILKFSFHYGVTLTYFSFSISSVRKLRNPNFLPLKDALNFEVWTCTLSPNVRVAKHSVIKTSVPCHSYCVFN